MSDQLKNFLDVLDSGNKKFLTVPTTTNINVEILPLSFKQQKTLITTSLNGLVGVMSFIKNLNDVILTNSSEKNLKVYDRVPILLELRKDFSSKELEKDDVKINVQDLINQFKKFDGNETAKVDGIEYTVHLSIPTLIQENTILASCIEELKKIDNDNIAKNFSLILSYEMPKFISKITFGKNIIKFDDLTISEKIKIIDKLPANVTNNIMEFIVKVREYDEHLLTYNGVTLDIDTSFFE